ncbi:MAG: MoxR family ATPase [Haloferacaceae archaeon]|jgi:MoxR-like ATPase
MSEEPSADGDPQAVAAALRDRIDDVLVGYEDVVEQTTIAVLAGGHVLLEGVPGVAKTTAARLFARASGLGYQRVQMTPDVLPADITGTHVYREDTGEFEVRRGPVFTNVLLADEINRATPKTQSALIESMRERTATIEGDSLPLPEPFLVIATQNPVEYEGTYALPQAQRDRFLFKMVMEIPSREVERTVLERFTADPTLDPDSVEPAVTPAAISEARAVVRDVHVDARVLDYVLDLMAATRESPATDHGGSPRASLALAHASQARAAVDGRSYVIPDDVKTLALPTLRHRLVLDTEATMGGQTADDVIAEILRRVETPEADLVEPSED